MNQIESPDDYLNGRRISTDSARPQVWVSHPSWIDNALATLPEEAKQRIPANAESIKLVCYEAFQDLKREFKETSRLIQELDGKPSFFDSWYSVERGLLLYRNPYTLGENAFEILALYYSNNSQSIPE